MATGIPFAYMPFAVESGVKNKAIQLLLRMFTQRMGKFSQSQEAQSGARNTGD
jgi:hypothetical protein